MQAAARSAPMSRCGAPAAAGPGSSAACGGSMRQLRPASRHPPCQLRAPASSPRRAVHVCSAAPLARSQQEERTHQKAANALHQLEVLKREQAAAHQLRIELDARTAAMANMQQQLEQMEKMRQAEAEAAAARFREFEQALAMAERSMDGGDGFSAEEVSELQRQLASKERDLATAQQLVADLQHQQLSLLEEARQEGRRQGGIQEAAALRQMLGEQQGMLEEAAAAAEAAEAERAALEQQVSLLRDQTDLLRRQVEKRDAEAALQQRELEAARRETAAATQRLAQLREAVATEAQATALVLDKAERAARMLGEQLLALMQSRQEEEAAEAAEAEAAKEQRQYEEGRDGEATSFLTESDADALLDELEFLQQQLGKQQRVMEDAILRASNAEGEAAVLRERLLSSAAAATSAPAPAVAAIYNSDLERQFSEAAAIAAAAEAEAEALAVQNQGLLAEVARLRGEAEAAAEAAAAAVEAAAAAPQVGVPGFGGASASQLAAALERVSALERQNAELRDAAAKKDTVLAESRKFIQSYLQRTAAAADHRHGTMRDAGAASSPASSSGPTNGSPSSWPAARSSS